MLVGRLLRPALKFVQPLARSVRVGRIRVLQKDLVVIDQRAIPLLVSFVELSDLEVATGLFSFERTDDFLGLRDARVNGQRIPIPANIRRDVQTCPRCASLAPECDNPEHAVFYRGRAGRCGCREEKVKVRLVAVS